MCSQVFDRKSTVPPSGKFCSLAELDSDSWSLKKVSPSKLLKNKYVFFKLQQKKVLYYFHMIDYVQAIQTVLF